MAQTAKLTNEEDLLEHIGDLESGWRGRQQRGRLLQTVEGCVRILHTFQDRYSNAVHTSISLNDLPVLRTIGSNPDSSASRSNTAIRASAQLHIRFKNTSTQG
jgi:hypothetical protein